MNIVIHHTPTNVPGIDLATRFVNEALLPNLSGKEANKVIAVMLGGSHAKNLANKRSDLDLTVYYTTPARNLLAFRRKTLTLHGLKQKGQERDQVFYDWEGLEVELAMHPWRRVGQGFDLAGALHTGNMKTLHDWVHHYNVYPTEEFRLIDEFIRGPEYDWPVDAVVGYCQGYATSQLLNHKRKVDFATREQKALDSNDVTPVVKHMMNGLYIGLSGLFLLDCVAVSRDFEQLWRFYEGEFEPADSEFVWEVWRHKTDRPRKPIPNVAQYVAQAADVRVRIFERLRGLFDVAAPRAVAPTPAGGVGRWPVEPDRVRNAEALDRLQEQILELR